jgi:L-rhamnose mutarotase
MNMRRREQMVRTVYLGVLSPEGIAEYERLHNNLPEVILRNLREGGVTDLKIYRLGNMAVMTIDRDESAIKPDRKFDREAEDTWQKATGDCFTQRWQAMPMIFDLPEMRYK